MPETLSLADTIVSLLKADFLELMEGVWWQILPVNDEYDYDIIACGIGVCWKNFLPLLLHNGLFYTRLSSTVNTYLVSDFTWKISAFFLSNDRLQPGT